MDRYRSTPAIEIAVAAMSATNEDFWGAIGSRVDPLRVNNPYAGVVFSILREGIANRMPHPRGRLVFDEWLAKHVHDGRYTQTTADKIVSALNAVQLQDIDTESLRATFAEVLREAETSAVLADATEGFAKSQVDLTAIATKLEDIAAIGKVGQSAGMSVTFDDSVLTQVADVYMGERASWGIDELDAKTQGGPTVGTVSLFAAATGVGKSPALTSVAVSALIAGYDVALITNELDQHTQRDRLLCNLLDMTFQEFAADRAKRQAGVPEEKIEMYRRLAWWRERGLGHLLIHRFGVNDFHTVPMIELEIRRSERRDLRADGKHPEYRVIVVDYLDHVRGTKLSALDTSQQQTIASAADVTGRLGDLAKARNGWCFSAVQLKAGHSGKASATADGVGGSYEKAKITDNLVIIGRTPQDELDNTCHLTVVKFRQSIVDKGTIGPLPSDLIHSRAVRVIRDTPWNREAAARGPTKAEVQTVIALDAERRASVQRRQEARHKSRPVSPRTPFGQMLRDHINRQPQAEGDIDLQLDDDLSGLVNL